MNRKKTSKVGTLMYIDGVVHVCVAAGLGAWHHGGIWIPTTSLATWMIEHGYATGHGDTFDHILTEFKIQARKRGNV